MVEALNGYRPDVMITYPTVTGMLAEEQLEGRLRIVPSIIGLGSEVLTDDVARRIRDAWSIVPFDVYASTEAPIIAAESPDHVGLHISEDLLVVEAVDEDNRPVPPGQPSHKVLVTNLVSRTQPLIRYELSDSVVFADGPDPSGRPYRRILRVDGRNDDVLRLPRPGGGFVAVNPYRLRAPFSGLPEVCQYQIRERGGELRVLVVLRHDAPRDIGARVRAALRRELTESGALPPRIEVEPVAAIDREAGAGAKLKLVKNDEA
jgi:phenylacetate-coenzyme A ligase PaaK-like adenylate-forming protein